MGQTTLDLWGGGATVLTPAVNTILVWWWDRRIQTISASVGGLTMTVLPATLIANMPWGANVLIVVNPKTATQTFTLRDTPGTWSFTMGIGKACFVSRVKNAGTAQWWPALMTIL